MPKINFVTSDKELIDMAYGDSIYAWLLLHSHYDPEENHNYIYKRDFSFTEIARDIHKTRQTVSKRFEALLALSKDKDHVRSGRRDLIYYDESNQVYILPCFRDFQSLDSDTVLNLFWMIGQKKDREELIKLYAWLKKKYFKNEKDISYTEIIEAFGHSATNEQTYNRIKDLLTTLQGAGLIKFRTDLDNFRKKNGKFAKTLFVYQVNDRASQEWIDKKQE